MYNNFNASAERFRAALRINTVWPERAESGGDEEKAALMRLERFQDFLDDSYPAFRAATERHLFGPFAVAYRWPGKNGEALPVLLAAHYDVVPVEADKWSVDPFEAETREGHIVARGALDTKNTLIGALEAAETHAASGFAPDRDIWFAFGGDEERSGINGAKAMAAWFEEKGITFDWMLDEGGLVAVGEFPGVTVPIALVGVEEKGFLDLTLTVRQAPGHSSRPPDVQAVAVLARALTRLSRKPFPFSLTPTVERFFASLGEHAPGLRGFAMRHARSFGPVFFRIAAVSPAVASFLRTTLAMTQLFGSEADNVLPSEARAVLNLRLLPGWTVTGATERVRRIVNDRRVEVSVSRERTANDPTPATQEVARGEGPGWKEVIGAISASFPEAVPVPFLVNATTDSRHYSPVCAAIYRFAPLMLDGAGIALMHNHDERISLDNFGRGIAFYRALIGTLGDKE